MTGKEPTPQSIPKTVVFMDGKPKVANIAQAIIDQLVLMGYSIPLAYSTTEGFHAFTSGYDKDRILDEFRKPDSHIRILVATTAVGLGMNLPDIKRVAVYGLLITMDLGDLMQRLGRAARAAGVIGDAIIFLPLTGCFRTTDRIGLGRSLYQYREEKREGREAVPISRFMARQRVFRKLY